MIARSLSWSERRPDGVAAAAAAVGVVLFLGCFALLHAGALGRNQIVDTPTYQRYGDAIVDAGAVPYRDFPLEYPPGALPAFVLDRVETPTPVNALGAKGCGEAGTIGATPAVVNAVLDALAPLGVRHLDMPLTPARVWAAIGAARAGATKA